MRNILKITATIAAAVLMIDAAGLAAWILSGQYPADSFYLGTITAHVLGLLVR